MFVTLPRKSAATKYGMRSSRVTAELFEHDEPRGAEVRACTDVATDYVGLPLEMKRRLHGRQRGGCTALSRADVDLSALNCDVSSLLGDPERPQQRSDGVLVRV